MKITFTFCILGLVMLSGCGTPSQGIAPFPTPPTTLMAPPEKLQTILKPDEISKLKIEDRSPSNVQLSAATKVITNNYKICTKNYEQVLDLQLWILQQQKINP